MPTLLKQGSFYSLVYPIRQDGGTVASITDAKWVLYRSGTAVLTKTLSSGIAFASSQLTVTLDDSDTVSLSGGYDFEVWITDANANAVYVTSGNISFEVTKTRF